MSPTDYSNYFLHLFQEILLSINNDHVDNYDHLRFGPSEDKRSFSIKQSLRDKLHEKGYFHKSNATSIAGIIREAVWVKDFEYLYTILEDDESRELLIKIVAYRLLGHRKVKLPLSTPDYWENIHRIESYQSKEDVIQIDFMNFKLPLTDLSFLKVPLKLYYSAFGVNIDFIIKQYEFHRNGVHIQAEGGDTIIDGGGCFGDTALYFADKVTTNGQAHVFEFIPDNINIFEKNIGLNPQLAPVVKLVKHPLWSHSNEEVFYQSNGPGSKVSFESFEGYSGKTSTLSIDDYVGREGLQRLDFIKMDIEGAEYKALHGAVNTLKKYRPKLAIALYHSTQDFDIIPRFLKELDLGYKFYLSHSTIYGEETMLFAVAE